MSVTPVLEALAVAKRYGPRTALTGVSLAVGPGECVALVGESGSGKTTLLRCFNRLVVPDAGSVRVRGRDIAGLDPVQLRRETGYVPQDGGLLPHWDVLRNVALVPWLLGLADARDRAGAALSTVGLPPAEFGGLLPSGLSGGQRQRVAIARAIAAGPAVILLDEPFSALDALTRAGIQRVFADVRRRVGFTALLVTHDIPEAFALADRVAVLRAGAIVQDGPPGDLLERPATPWVRDLVARAGVHRA